MYTFIYDLCVYAQLCVPRETSAFFLEDMMYEFDLKLDAA